MKFFWNTQDHTRAELSHSEFALTFSMPLEVLWALSRRALKTYRHVNQLLETETKKLHMRTPK